jgi:hypothetical protein
VIVDEPVTITLNKAQALVLFELLADFRDGSVLPIRNEAERAALWAVENCLEKTLAEPFRSDYGRILDEARKKVVAEAFGGPSA